jgi:hypothetical protein
MMYAYIDAGIAFSGSYRSADKKGYKNTALCSDIEPSRLFTTASATLCSQTRATTSMHSICMMHTLMLEQFLLVATAALTRKHVYVAPHGDAILRSKRNNSTALHTDNLLSVMCLVVTVMQPYRENSFIPQQQQH